jgi:hypothetical protein
VVVVAEVDALKKNEDVVTDVTVYLPASLSPSACVLTGIRNLSPALVLTPFAETRISFELAVV